ncbi:YhgE/Pip domain-containing protein [Streptomyces meridianus]|uniref:YhgE/Pip domain-containing protein n=1 Tax=Streptomyces meridianus TaxID=2938945 RepID=A0ABT0X1L0_9ACTN|nr:YhgE/Pip domain-containing protein [Streptomyces meridianus]MCM2576442.1 YhgE/Pip domain-containing protein [Streptomyces meridianus]
MRSPKLAALELKRFGRGRLPRAALAAVLLLPLLYGALYLWSFWDPYGRLDRIPVALVNADRGTNAGGHHIDAGDEIADGLRESGVFAWREVSASEAERGVENGDFYLSLTVPSDFSRRLASASGDLPRAGALRVRTNDANNYVVGQISRTVFSEVRAAVSAKTARSYLDRIFVSFSDIHAATEKAAKGADRIDRGIGKARKGAGALSRGLADAGDGSGALADGLRKLDDGAGTLDSGAGSLKSGAGKVSTGAAAVARGTQKLADRVNGFAGPLRPFLEDHGEEIGRSARLLSLGSKTTADDLGKLPASASRAAKDAREASGRIDSVYRARCGAGIRLDVSCPQLKKAADAAERAATAAERVDRLVSRNASALGKVTDDLRTLHRLASALAERGPHLAEDLGSAVHDVNALNDGAHKVAAGARKVAAGAGSLAEGTGKIHAGTGSAHRGSQSLDAGIGKLSDGADTLNGGMYRLADGSQKLAGGLHDGADRIPDYDKHDRDARTAVMADPVRLASGSAHTAPDYGTGFAPYFIPLSLWVGAMVAYMLIQPLNRRALAAGAPAWRIALAGWLPVAGLGLAQMAALMSVLHWGLGLRMERAAGTIGFLCLVTLCFTAIVQWLNARFGPAGRILVLALLMLQLTSAGGTYPVQTSPGFFNAVHPYLPMTHVVEGLRRLITGGSPDAVLRGCAVLACFTLGALTLTAWSARRKQVWTLDRLHPELSL